SLVPERPERSQRPRGPQLTSPRFVVQRRRRRRWANRRCASVRSEFQARFRQPRPKAPDVPVLPATKSKTSHTCRPHRPQKPKQPCLAANRQRPPTNSEATTTRAPFFRSTTKCLPIHATIQNSLSCPLE